MKSFVRFNLAAVAFVSLLAGPAFAGSIKVSSNGADSATCGSGANGPCATIQQAIMNAADGDSILVGPGAYAGVVVGKRLKLWSSGGLGAAVITSSVTLASNGTTFGLPGKGFMLKAAAGITVSANDVTVRGNVFSGTSIGVTVNAMDATVRDNAFDYCGIGVQVNAAGAEVRRNRFGLSMTSAVSLTTASSGADVRENKMFGPSGSGIAIDGSNHLVRRNLIQSMPYGIVSMGAPSNVQLVENAVIGSLSLGYNLSVGTGWVLSGNAAIGCNAPGFYLTAATPFTLKNNVAINNSGYGIYISGGSNHVLDGNTAINNISSGNGILLASVGAGVQITGGNLYGNDTNCGIFNSSMNAVIVDKTYWGAASGPGGDPADNVCGNIAGTVVTNPASKAAPIKLPPLK